MKKNNAKRMEQPVSIWKQVEEAIKKVEILTGKSPSMEVRNHAEGK